MEVKDLEDLKMQAMRIRKSIDDSREITIKIPVGFSDNVEIIVLPLETEELSEREFDNFKPIYISEEKVEEKGRFFSPSAFDFWNEPREDLYQEHLEKKGK
jgi:hypothetical protein